MLSTKLREMKKRRNIVAGNWKMNKDYNQGRSLATNIAESLQVSDAIVIIGAPFIHLKGVSSIINGIQNLHLSAQNFHEADSGAYTGEISAAMLKSVGCKYVILGHSERRSIFGETDETIAAKVNQALKHDLIPIFCCGEMLPSREAGEQEKIVGDQIKKALFQLPADEMSKVVIAYEPVWAIGTGVTASPEQAQDMHAFIRSLLKDKYGEELADGISILYGGSVKPGNAKDIFSKEDVDGGLIGGASLKAEDFLAIVNSI
jgi:triosephosphate isomerase